MSDKLIGKGMAASLKGHAQLEVDRKAVAKQASDLSVKEQQISWGVLALLFVLLLFSYWQMIFGPAGVIVGWKNPLYSHGWLVPIFTAVLLALRYQPLGSVTPAERWAGLGVILLSVMWRLVAARYGINTLDMVSFVPALLGLALLIGGWKMLRWAGPPIAFLVFMYPLPQRVETGLLGPLQTVATMTSHYALQTLGIESTREGNHIILSERSLNVEEACSGLRMVTIFIALSVAIVMVTERPWWEQFVILASALPIALLCNIIRITVTGVLYVTASPELAESIFHDFAGWVMMPMALGFMYIELTLLSHLWIEEEAPPAGFGFRVPGAPIKPV